MPSLLASVSRSAAVPLCGGGRSFRGCDQHDVRSLHTPHRHRVGGMGQPQRQVREFLTLIHSLTHSPTTPTVNHHHHHHQCFTSLVFVMPSSPPLFSVAFMNTWPSILRTTTSRRRTIPHCSSPQVRKQERSMDTPFPYCLPLFVPLLS